MDLIQYVDRGSVRQPRLGVIKGQVYLQDGRISRYCINGGNIPYVRQNSLSFEGFNDYLDEDTSLDIPPWHDGHFVWSDLSHDNGLELVWESQDGFMALAVPPDMIDWQHWARQNAKVEAWRREFVRRYHASKKRKPGQPVQTEPTYGFRPYSSADVRRPARLPEAVELLSMAAAAAAALLLTMGT